ncbi:phenylacetate--CoA ligase family protein [Shewanella sp. JBTF-M18]|uniref:Phenylacetate--CoA ligase family protein n=1 Tax=Shewanella insulae TaxID=2681496 RepID=A0A6L7HYK2_9GAMM|nr:phenylacetate--CoA ligase family protein [Shewanella insulae]MXR69409.1 phenylacetate--CoA ligase family protein [Shewanella insulae]
MALNFIKKIIFKLGVAKRNPSFNEKFISLMKTDFADRDELDILVKNKLRDLLVFSQQYSNFYRDRFNKQGIILSENFDPFDVLSRLPTVTKSDLITSNKLIDTTSFFPFKKTFFSETSGSSGEPLTFLKNEEWDSANRAAIARGMSWYGVEFSDRNGYFWGYSFSKLQIVKTKFFDFLLNRFRLFSYSDEDIQSFMKKAENAVYIHGYSSMIYEVARKANSNGMKLNNIKFVKGTSEKIYAHYNDEAFKAFGRKIVSEYGAAEAGIIAFECPEGNMHINEENCLVEVIDEKIVVTNLESLSFPIIRYELGDFVKLSEKQCSCGRHHKVISEVLGRVGKNIYGKENKVFPSLTLYYIFKRLALECGYIINYRAEQHEIGKLVFFLEGEVSQEVNDKVLDFAQSYFLNTVEVELKNESVIHSKNKKLKDFESFL